MVRRQGLRNECMRSRRCEGPRLRGATLLEVVIVISILCLLISLVVVAVVKVRDVARKASCINNFKQIGIGLNSYVTRYGSFPDGHGWNGFSPLVGLLPDLDQAPLFNAINLTHPGIYPAAENATAAASRIGIFVCPQDGASNPADVSMQHTNYAGNWGVGVQAFGYNGAFAGPGRKTTRPAQIRDGLSSTAGFSEWLVGSPTTMRDGRRTVFRTSIELLEREQFEKFAEHCRKLDPALAAPTPPFSKGTNWMVGDFGFTMYNHTLNPNERTCTNGSAFQQGAWTTGSNHGGGVNLLLLDGSARFVKDSIQNQIWHALGSRDGSEIIQGQF